MGRNQLYRITRVLVASAALAALATPYAPATAMPTRDAVSVHEVRLRKLHLVRPDLIKYPIAVEVYC